MRLPQVFLFTAALGACGSLLMAVDIHFRMKDASRAGQVSNAAPAVDSILVFGNVHIIGLAALAFLFMALFLMLLSALRDREFISRLEGKPATEPVGAVLESPVSVAGSDLSTERESAMDAEAKPQSTEKTGDNTPAHPPDTQGS